MDLITIDKIYDACERLDNNKSNQVGTIFFIQSFYNVL